MSPEEEWYRVFSLLKSVATYCHFAFIHQPSDFTSVGTGHDPLCLHPRRHHIGMVGPFVGPCPIINAPANIVFGRSINREGQQVPSVIGLFGDVTSMSLYALSRNPLHLALVRVLHDAGGALVAASIVAIDKGDSVLHTCPTTARRKASG